MPYSGTGPPFARLSVVPSGLALPQPPRIVGLLNVSMIGIGMHSWSPYVPPLTPSW